MALEGADDGTLLWVARDDRLDCAVILHPDEVLERAALVTYVAMVGLREALGVVVPPMTEVTYTWPNRIEANGGGVAAIGLELPKGAAAGSVPDWMVVFARVAVTAQPAGGSDAEPGVTTLREEGCVGLTRRACWKSLPDISWPGSTVGRMTASNGFAPCGFTMRPLKAKQSTLT